MLAEAREFTGAGRRRVAGGALSVGELVSFAGYAVFMVWPVQSLDLGAGIDSAAVRLFAERAHNGNCTGKNLHEFLQNIGRPPPAWVSKEIQPVNHVPPKGTIAACIYKAALSAGSIKPEGE